MAGISKVLVAENAAFEGFLPEKVAPVLLASQDQFKYTHIFAGASAFSRYNYYMIYQHQKEKVVNVLASERKKI